MKKLHSLAFYALIAPAMTLGASSVLAQQSTGGADERQQQSTQRDQTKGAMESKSRTSASDRKMDDPSRMQSRNFLDAGPVDGAHASNLIGAEVKTAGDEDVGSVQDLIIDADGQVVAIVIAVGGFLGMGEKDVAIGWDHVTRSGAADEQDLRIDMTREELQAAPEFQQED